MIKIYSLTGDVKHDILCNHSGLVHEIEAEEFNNWNIKFTEDTQLLTYKDHVSLFVRDNGEIIDAVDIDLNMFSHVNVL